MSKTLLFLFIIFFGFVSFANIDTEVPKDSLFNDTTTIKNKLPKDFLKTFDEKMTSGNFHYKTNESEFNEAYIQQNFAIDSITNEALNKAKAVINILENTQNYINLVSTDDLVTLPVGVKKTIGHLTYIFGISKATFSPEYTEVTGFVRIMIPEADAQGNQKQLFFGANNIRISHSGGIYGDANLVLLGDVPIPINGGNAMIVLKGGFDMNTGDVTQKTYVTVDCGGFKELGIDADVMFPRSMLEPVIMSSSNNFIVDPNPKAKVTGNFTTTVADWSDILAEISLPRFQLTKNDNPDDGTGKAGLIFELNTAVFDFSDVRNSPSVRFPNNYSGLIPGNKELWRGVYVESLSVILPAEFKKRNDTNRVSFIASNLLIDNLGVSGKFSVDDILPIDEGEASKWQFSVDHIEAEFVTNQIVSAEFDGKIVLPITEKVSSEEAQNSDPSDMNKKVLTYSATMDLLTDQYVLNVSSATALSFDVFKAKATLAPDSYIELRVADHKFKPKAVLTGTLEIKGSNGDDANSNKHTVDFEGVTFQNLQLQTESPYFQVDHMGYSGEVKMANFPVSIANIGVTANDTEASLHFDLAVNLMGENNGFKGDTRLGIIGSYGENEGISNWQFDRIDIERIELDVSLGAVKMDGFVDIKTDDPTYGDGFYGQLHATFNDNIEVTATAMFGKTDIRYWYVDAFADLGNMGIAIGPVLVNGFGGGAYYHMTTNSNAPMPIYNGEPVEMGPPSPSGKTYVPDANAGLGFRALVGFALTTEKAFNGKVGFELAFNTSGGLDRAIFFGEGHIVKALDFSFGEQFKAKLTAMEEMVSDIEDNAAMTALKEANLVEYSKAAFPQDGLTFDVGIDANFAMEMNFEDHSFHSTMEVFVNTPGGFFKGVGPNGRAGWSVFHTDSEGWYLHMGTPTDRIGLQLGVGNFNVEATTYLMIGDNIPESPPPPAIVADILGVELDQLDSMRDLNALGDGRGFALGMDLSIDTGDMTFLIFYANFQAGLGFDIMIKDYGETACAGSGSIGIDGWYANGQAYVYLQGELGIKVKLLGVRKKIPIITAGAAVLLQAKLPNPSWFRGYVGGYYNLLGGLVKGNFRFKMELGEECEIVGGAPLGGLKIISDISPNEGDFGVDVFTVPQSAFNMKINTPFELEDDQGTKTYRIILDEFIVTNDGVSITGDLVWNNNNDVANFVSFDILPPNTLMNISVKVSFQERINGIWTTLTENGETAQEVESINFTTGEAPDYIPITNIKYCYPVIDQEYFYKDERNTGYVKLKMGQPYLFSPQTDWTQVINFENNGTIDTITQVSYNTSEKTVNFNLPILNNQQTYNLQIISTPPESNDSNENQITYSSQDTGQDGNTVEIKNVQAQSIINDNANITELLTYNFSTSNYNTFADKINDKTQVQVIFEPVNYGVHALQSDVQNSERFSLLELNGGNFTNYKALVKTEGVLDDNYFTNTVYPMIYDGYPLQPNFTVNRDINILGLPPKKGLDIVTWYSSYLENNPSDVLLNVRIPYRYYLAYYYKSDFYDIQNNIAVAYQLNPSAYQENSYLQILNGQLPDIQAGNYKTIFKYILPGNIEGTSSIFTYINPY